MKKILFLLLLIPVIACGQSYKISELPAATAPDADDIMEFVEDGTSKKITYELLLDWASDSLLMLIDSIVQHRLELNTLQTDTFTIDAQAYVLTDTIPFYTFGAGGNQAGDTAFFDTGDKAFGGVYCYNDTTVIPNFKLVDLSTGDTWKFNAYYGDMIAGTKTDSLFTGPVTITTSTTISNLTPNNTTKIPPGNDFWIEGAGAQTAGQKPVRFILQANKQTIRD